MLIEYRHLPHETLTQDLPSHEKWATLRAKNEIGQISSKTENVAILLSWHALQKLLTRCVFGMNQKASDQNQTKSIFKAQCSQKIKSSKFE